MPAVRAFAFSQQWACGAAGSALPWHGRGRRFDPGQVHHFSQQVRRREYSTLLFPMRRLECRARGVPSPQEPSGFGRTRGCHSPWRSGGFPHRLLSGSSMLCCASIRFKNRINAVAVHAVNLPTTRHRGPVAVAGGTRRHHQVCAHGLLLPSGSSAPARFPEVDEVGTLVFMMAGTKEKVAISFQLLPLSLCLPSSLIWGKGRPDSVSPASRALNHSRISWQSGVTDIPPKQGE